MTDLSIQVDEEKGRPVILECRREWLDGRSENHRTYYTTPLPTPDEALVMDSKELTRSTEMQLPGKRRVRDCHAEYDIRDPLGQRLDFIPAYTRHSGYHLAAATYIDLVNDPKFQADGVRSQHCLWLRTKSRKRSYPTDRMDMEQYRGLLLSLAQPEADGRPERGSEERFDSHGVCLWPSEDAPSEELELLCPDISTSLVRAVWDERSLIYSASAEKSLLPHHHMLVLINFDSMVRFPYLISLRKQKASTKSTRKLLDAPWHDLHSAAPPHPRSYKIRRHFT
ncbi:hypothetical protein N7475_000207 [Penicillium sp. IBT 31633x]|nr:hypothetical protein N7475_000207 [Penicillium sp. IBT 31633x]